MAARRGERRERGPGAALFKGGEGRLRGVEEGATGGVGAADSGESPARAREEGGGAELGLGLASAGPAQFGGDFFFIKHFSDKENNKTK